MHLEKLLIITLSMQGNIHIIQLVFNVVDKPFFLPKTFPQNDTISTEACD